MLNLYTRLFKPVVLKEETDAQAMEDTGLVSPYSVSKAKTVGINAEELTKNAREIGYTIANTHNRCSHSINLIKSTDLDGFLTFKSRVKDTLSLNNLLSDNEAMQDQLSELAAWAYAAVSANKGYFIFSNADTAKKVAIAISSKLKSAGLLLPTPDLSKLLLNVLITVLTKLDHGKQKQ